MAGKKNRQSKENAGASIVKDTVLAFLDDVLRQAAAEEQFESFYENKAAELQAIDENCLPAVARRFQKASSAERDALLKLLKYFTGFQHIQYLQDLIAREALLPRHGMLMLDIFNRSDVMLESGMASRLLDLDSLAQRIRQHTEGTANDSRVIGDFLQRSAREQEGIINQLIDEKGAGLAGFISLLYRVDAAAAERIVQTVTQYQGMASFNILDDLYRRTGLKDIDKIRKKAARALKQQGIDVALGEAPKPVAAVFKKAELPPCRTFVSGLDAEGFQLVFMIRPLSQYEYKLFTIIIQYAKGIHDVEVITLFRRELNAWIEKIVNDKSLTVIEDDSDYGAFMVDQACRISEAAGTIISANIAQWRRYYADCIGKLTSQKIADLIGDAGTGAPCGDEASLEILFESSDLHYWYAIQPEARRSWEAASGVSEKSQEVPGDCTEQSQLDAAEEFFTAERRAEFSRRLEAQAYILHLTGSTDAARAALSAAAGLQDDAVRPGNNLFCRELIRRGFDFFAEAFRTYRRRSNSSAAGTS